MKSKTDKKIEGDVFQGGVIVTTTKIKDKIEGVPYFNTIITRSTVKAFETFYIVDTNKTPEQIKKIMTKQMFGNYKIEDQYANRGRWSGFYITPKFQDRITISYSMLLKDQTEYEYALKFAPIICQKLKAPMIMIARELYSNTAKVVFFDKKGKLEKEKHFQTAHDASKVMMDEHKVSINDLYMNLQSRINGEQHRIKYMNGGISMRGISQIKLKSVSLDQFKFYFPKAKPEDGKVIEQFWFDPFQEVK